MNDDDSPPGKRGGDSPTMGFALDVLGLLKDCGVTLTEIEPTDAMIAAGMAVSGIGEERTRATFRAMVAAGGEPVKRLQ